VPDQQVLLVKFDTGRVEKLSQFINKGTFTMMGFAAKVGRTSANGAK
jgi:hypothetical protein